MPKSFFAFLGSEIVYAEILHEQKQKRRTGSAGAPLILSSAHGAYRAYAQSRGGERLVHRAEKSESKPPSRCSTGGFTGGSGSPYSQPLTFCGFPGLGLVVFDPYGSGLRERVCLPAYRTICLGLPDMSRGLPSIRLRFILQTTSLPGQFGCGVFSRSASGLDECLEFSAHAGERSGFCFDRLHGLRFFLLFGSWSGN